MKFTTISLLIVSWIGLLFIISPQKIVESIGIANVYIIIFLIAAITGGSSFTAPSMYGLLITFVSGGASIIPVALLAGLGSTIGDSFYMLLGSKSHAVLPSKIQKKLQRYIEKLETKPHIIMPFFIFSFAAFVPFPNDLMTLSLGITGYRIRNAILPILFGNMVYFFLMISVGVVTLNSLV